MANPYQGKATESNKLRAKARKIAGDTNKGYATPFKHTLKDTTGGLLSPDKTYASGGAVHQYPKMTAGAESGAGRLEKSRKY